MELIIYTDGASRGNPGPASYGFTISDIHKKLIYNEGKFIGRATNNVAEYTAVMRALEYIKKKYANKPSIRVNLHADSKLLVEQLSGRYKVKSTNLKALFDKIKILELEIGSVFYTHVYRIHNSVADRLANLALDQKMS